MEVWKADPLFTNFVPKTAVEAVDRYIRCRRKGLMRQHRLASGFASFAEVDPVLAK